MKINKNQFLFLIERQFLVLFPLAVMLFFPSKELMGKFSFPDVFTFVQFFLFVIYIFVKAKIFIRNETIALSLIVVFCFISLIINNADQFIYKSKYILRWVNYFITFLITINYLNKSNYNYFLKGIYVSTFLICAYGILQKLFFDYFFKTIFWIHTFPDYIHLTFRSVSFMDNPLTLCAFLAFSLGTLQFINNKKLIHIVLIIMVFITLYLTASKIALALMILSFLVFLSRFKKFFKYFMFIIIPIILLFTFNQSASKLLKSDFSLYDRLTNNSTYSGSVNTRIAMYKASLKMIQENYLWGIGNENFKTTFNNLDENYTNIKVTNSSYTAENFFLDFYLDYGLLPLLLLMTLIFPMVNSYYFGNKNLKAISFSIVLFIVVGMIMSARAVPLMYMLFFYTAIFYKKQSYILNE